VNHMTFDERALARVDKLAKPGRQPVGQSLGQKLADHMYPKEIGLISLMVQAFGI
jgi:hypothetical protein